jgi:predicted NBD/HSP70 family sugar kinase
MNATFDALMDEHARGVIDIWSVLQQASHYLGIAVANHINTHDPAEIIIVGPSVAQMDKLRSAFFKALEDNTFPALRRRTKLHFRLSDKGLYAKGAAAMVLERLYAA